MLVRVDTLDGCATRELHEDVSLDNGLCACHDEIDGPHVPSQ